MKFLLDVCTCLKALEQSLVAGGHDVLAASRSHPDAADDGLLRIALEEDRVLITLDKDFGELVFVRKQLHPTIVRLVGMSVDEQVTAIQELLSSNPDDLAGPTIIVVSRDRVRVRRHP
ncbi:DUF5615 family PIN-like protein [Limnochorda pilosa]|uniref:DUF5615 domain-containing protein n=1 Tax=Limnochorda pilosa TaxID=1555112 RepID=A0A0K2SQL6_LIMPI|nr:DUF5615 family PIN-like protein [Limnochorda pilosa]BAS29287.1 hypothetical protein LIP_3475 [Limnochorda pilosa]